MTMKTMSGLTGRRLLVAVMAFSLVALMAGAAFASSGSDSPDISGVSITVPSGPDDSIDEATTSSDVTGVDSDSMYDDSLDDVSDDSMDDSVSGGERSVVAPSGTYERHEGEFDE